jgi:uncharacterized protein (TIGR00251 family)
LSDFDTQLALDDTPQGVAFYIHVTPRAKHPGVGGNHGDALRVAVAAAPIDGKANEACREALATALDCKKIDIEIDPGSKGRRKRIKLVGNSRELRGKLQMLARSAGLR